jgi:hypothetical protein
MARSVETRAARACSSWATVRSRAATRASTGSAGRRRPGRGPRRAAGGAVGLDQDAELLGDEVGEREPLDQVGRVLVAGG